MIQGKFEAGAPRIEAIILFPSLNTGEIVNFLIDTGATRTVIHPQDSMKMGIDFTKLRNETYSVGIGGRSKVFYEPAILSLYDYDESTIHRQDLAIAIAEPAQHNAGYPSLLGRDVLNLWNIDYYARNGKIIFR